jgi:CheY-like chemotaxis protein
MTAPVNVMTDVFACARRNCGIPQMHRARLGRAPCVSTLPDPLLSRTARLRAGTVGASFFAVPRARARILVVDDDPSVLRVVRRILATESFELLEADSAESAVALASQAVSPVDLLLTDVVLPPGNCEPMVRQLREMWAGLRVLYMSGYGADVVRRFGIREGAQILAKPFTPALLRQRVAEVLREGSVA